MSGLLERDAEAARLRAAVDDVLSGVGRVVVIEGPPGIGKTALLERAAASAGVQGLRVLTATGREVEQDVAFGVVRRLLGGLTDDRAFAGAAATARHVFPGAGAPPALALDHGFAVLQGLYWMVGNLAADGPLVLVVDDVQWIDEPSLRFLEFLGVRSAALPVALFAASRPAGPLLDVVATLEHAELLLPRPLSAEAVGTLLGLEGDDAARAFDRTGGNPFYVDAVRRALAGGDEAVLGGDDASALVRARLKLSDAARAFAEAVAVLGDGCRHDDAVALADLPDAAPLDELVGAGVLTAEVGFVHPLVLDAIRDGVDLARLEALRVAAARRLDGRGEPVGVVAAQLLHVSPSGDAWVVDRLRAAADAARAAGAPAAAVDLLRRAVAEPPPAAVAEQVQLELGLVEAFATDSAALDRLGALADTATEPAVRVIAAVARARLQLFRGDGEPAVATLLPVVESVGDPELSLLADSELVDAAWTLQSWDLRKAAIARIGERATPEHRLWCVYAVNAAFDAAAAAAPATEVEDAMAPVTGRLLGAVGSDAPTLYLAINTLGLAERVDLSRPLIAEALADARRRGSAFAHGYLCCYSAWVELRYGSCARAAAEATFARETLTAHGSALGVGLVAATVAETLVARGDVEGAWRALDLPDEADDPENPFTPFLLGARGRVLLALGDADAAFAVLQRCGAVMGQRGWLTPGLVPWRSLAAGALRRRGDVDHARELALEEVALARTMGRPRALGIALMAAAGCGVEGALDEAEAVLRGSRAVAEHARSLLQLGRMALDDGDQAGARRRLTEALDGASACEATAIAAAARVALGQAGARPRRPRNTGPDALTTAERRVADLAADGLSNRDIAETLFVTVKTVETHMSAVFRKLAVGSRSELATALGARTAAA